MTDKRTLSLKQVKVLIEGFGDEKWETRRRNAEILIKMRSAVVPLLLEAMTVDDENIRYWTIHTLGAINDPQGIEELLKLMKTGDMKTRAFAAGSLGKAKRPEVIQQLIESLEDTSWQVQESAAKSLQTQGKSALPPLAEALKQASDNVAFWIVKILMAVDMDILKKFLNIKNKTIRLLVTEALGDSATNKAVLLLVQFLKDPSWQVRQNTVDSLIKIGETVLEPLLVFIKDQEADLYYWVEKVLDGIEVHTIDPILPLLKKGDRDMRFNIDGLLGKSLDPRAIDQLIISLGDEYWFVAKNAANSLVQHGATCKGRIVDLLRDQDTTDNVRYWAGNILGRIGEEAVELLIGSLRDQDKNVRMLAAKALGEARSERAIEHLINALKDKEWPIRNTAAKALENYGPPIVEKITQYTMDHNDDIRIWVRRLIGKLGSSVIDNLLFTLENENDNTIRSAAAISLGIVRDAKAIDPLINTVLNDTDDWVRRYAAEALGEIGEKEVAGPLVETLLSPNPDLALYASRALGKLGPDAVDCLLPVLDSKNKNQRFLGICSLAELQVGEVYEELINLMAETDRKLHERVKEAAVNVGPDLISHLISGLGASDWNIRSNASDILLEIGETAVPALELAQNDENKEVQYWVSKTLRNIIKDLKHVGGGA